MKYIKTFETKVNLDNEKGYQEFLKEYNSNIARVYNLQHYKYMLENYNFPEIFLHEFSMLYYYYKTYSRYVRYMDKSVLNYIKKTVKKEALNSIIKKLEENPGIHIDLKLALDARDLNGTGFFDSIHDASIKYIFFLFYNALKKAPEWIKNSQQYNL